MIKKAKIGVVCLARETFDFAAAKEIYDGQKVKLKSQPEYEWILIDNLVISPEEAEQAATTLAAQKIDGLVIISGTFHLGHLALILHRELPDCPILLWAFSELPYNGGKIRLNSVCGINLNASNLYKAGFDQYSCTVGDDIDQTWLRAVGIKVTLKQAHVGLVGYRAHGFFNLSVGDLELYRRLGILVDHYEINELFAKTPDKLDQGVEKVKQTYDCAEVSQKQVEKVASLAETAEAFIRENALDAVALRCWPEFASVYGISPCAAISLLTQKGHTIACEGDVEGAISLLACRAVSQEEPFFADLSQVNFKENYALMWHCGVASPGLWDQVSPCTLDSYFAGGKGVTVDCVLKSGTVTLFRIDSARGKVRVFIQTGEAIAMEKELKGTYAKVRFNQKIEDLLETVTSTGIAHHVAMVYGDHAKSFKAFARMMDFEIIE